MKKTKHLMTLVLVIALLIMGINSTSITSRALGMASRNDPVKVPSKMTVWAGETKSINYRWYEASEDGPNYEIYHGFDAKFKYEVKNKKILKVKKGYGVGSIKGLKAGTTTVKITITGRFFTSYEGIRPTVYEETKTLTKTIKVTVKDNKPPVLGFDEDSEYSVNDPTADQTLYYYEDDDEYSAITYTVKPYSNIKSIKVSPSDKSIVETEVNENRFDVVGKSIGETTVKITVKLKKPAKGKKQYVFNIKYTVAPKE